MRRQSQPARGTRSALQLVSGPGLARCRLTAHMSCGETVKQRIVCRMHRHQLSLQMRRQFGNLQAMRGQQAADVVAIRLAVGRQFEIEQTRIAR